MPIRANYLLRSRLLFQIRAVPKNISCIYIFENISIHREFLQRSRLTPHDLLIQQDEPRNCQVVQNDINSERRANE